MAAAESAEPSWLVLRVKSPSEESAAWLAEGLIACGASAVQEEAGSLVTWFPAPADPEGFVARVATELRGWNAGALVQLEWEWRADEDWLAKWRAGLAPRRIGRIVVSPTWCAVESAAGDAVITIDPQIAFGTGEHASTRGVLRLMQEAIRPGDRVLDLGTGSAVLAIAAARLGAGTVTAVDCDGNALENARENVDRNGVADVVRIEEVCVDAAWLTHRAASWDLILANMLSGVLLPLVPSLGVALRDGGRAILAGILATEAPLVRASAGAELQIMAEDTELEWWSVAFRKTGGEVPARPCPP